jgi:hypothetical protein
MRLESFFDHLWQDYLAIAPMAGRLHQLLVERGEVVVNDHIAFRTFDRSPIHLEALEVHLLALGYQRYQPYHFADKHLRAFGYVHPTGPRVFLSQLETEHFSPFLRNWVEESCAAIDPERVKDPSILWSGRLWPAPPWEVYQQLAGESEYAGWVAALGLRANHFTVSINELKTFPGGFGEFLEFVKLHHFPLNEAGGIIKGSPEVLLEQASTLADQVEVAFADGVHRVPTCYYEFALRYAQPDGTLYPGFVAASADKIFQSTDRR